jgi:hypothetical protein
MFLAAAILSDSSPTTDTQTSYHPIRLLYGFDILRVVKEGVVNEARSVWSKGGSQNGMVLYHNAIKHALASSIISCHHVLYLVRECP